MSQEIFKEPSDYSVNRPIVRKNGFEYKIFKHAAGISFSSCPRLITLTFKAKAKSKSKGRGPIK